MGASTSWTASYPSTVAAPPSTPRRAACLPVPRAAHRFWAVARPARLLLIAVPGGIEGYFHEISGASTDGERRRIGERYGIHIVPDEPANLRIPTWVSQLRAQSAQDPRATSGSTAPPR
jgi:hypothetical protein